MGQPEHRFRIFVSYSHGDKQIAEVVIETLGKKYEVIWDKNILPGEAFSDAIKDGIAQSHVFMPIITRKSQHRPWVHQETGYAMALNIPVVPLAVGKLPTAMIEKLQAVPTTEDPNDIRERLATIRFEDVVCPPPPGPRSMVQVSEWPETRTELMAQYSNRVLGLGKDGEPNYVYLRQRGSISSFGIPDVSIDDSIWTRWDDPKTWSDYHHFLQREERRALEKHAVYCGFRLIIDPAIALEDKIGVSISAGKLRLEILLDFLKYCLANQEQDDADRDRASKPCYQVVIHSKARSGNLTILGDCFAAESRLPRAGKGYYQTIFTSHAPTVLRKVREFDQRFDEMLDENKIMPEESLDKAIKEVEKLIKEA